MDNEIRRVMRYAGNEWNMNNVPAQDFLEAGLVPLYPDLRGAQIRETRVSDILTVYEVFKQAGDKGC